MFNFKKKFIYLLVLLLSLKNKTYSNELLELYKDESANNQLELNIDKDNDVEKKLSELILSDDNTTDPANVSDNEPDTINNLIDNLEKEEVKNEENTELSNIEENDNQNEGDGIDGIEDNDNVVEDNIEENDEEINNIKEEKDEDVNKNKEDNTTKNEEKEEKNEDEDILLKRRLTLLDVLELALKNNPQVKQAWLNVDTSNYSHNMQLSTLLPTITGSLSYSKNKNKYEDIPPASKSESLTPSINMSYLLFNFGGRTADILNFKYKLNAVKFETNLFIQDFIYRVINAYYNLFSSLANERAATETENSSYEAFKSAALRYDIGLAPLTDKLQAETSYNQTRLVREKAENTVKIRKAELNYLLNLSPLTELDLELPFMDIRKDEFEANVVDLITKAVQNRPDLKAYLETKKAKKAELYKNAISWLPSVSLNASYGVNNDLENKRIPDESNYNIGISASMQFFTGGYVFNNIARSKAELKIVNQQIKDLEKDIELDVWTAYQDFITAKRTFITSEILVRSATETEKTMLGRYKNGKSSILDLLDAQSNLASARYELISAQHNWFISRANLLRAIGEMSLEELEKITVFANNQENSEVNVNINNVGNENEEK